MKKLFSCGADRVRGLSLHSDNSWILAGLENGDIELWDYGIGSLQHIFKAAHKGPVRSVHFHNSQPLFVSGGDDGKIMIWDHKERTSSVTFHGHEGRVNSVEFHHKFPWILSSSRDRTIRIWDWVYGKCLYKLKAHSDEVTSACFHLTQPLILSASMDQTIGLWDIRLLNDNPINQYRGQLCDKFFELCGIYTSHTELRGSFSNGITSAAFHPNLPLICSASASGAIETWRWTNEKWENMTLDVPAVEVSSILFHAKQNIIVAASGSILFAVDAVKGTHINTYVSDDMKGIEVLSSHPKKNLLAAGHNNGFRIFKFGSEFPIFSANGKYLYYIRGSFLYAYDFILEEEGMQLVEVLEPGASYLCRAPKAMSCSCTKTAVVICSEGGEGSYKLYHFPIGLGKKEANKIAHEVKSGTCISAVFVSEDKFAVLEKRSDYLLVKKLNNDPCSFISLPSVVDEIFYAGKERVICRSDDRVFIWDLSLNSIRGGNLDGIPRTRHVFWNAGMEYVALVGKHSIVIADSLMKKISQITETSHVKSGIWWEERKVFVYATLKHLKLCRLNGETKTLNSLDFPLYPAIIVGSKMYFFNRDVKLFRVPLNCS